MTRICRGVMLVNDRLCAIASYFNRQKIVESQKRLWTAMSVSQNRVLPCADGHEGGAEAARRMPELFQAASSMVRGDSSGVWRVAHVWSSIQRRQVLGRDLHGIEERRSLFGLDAAMQHQFANFGNCGLDGRGAFEGRKIDVFGREELVLEFDRA